MTQIEQIRHELTWSLRQKELYPGLPIHEMKLNEDLEGIHFGLFQDNQLISVVSVFDKDNSLQFRKFATSKEYQHKGYGTALLNYIIAYAIQEKKSSIWCNARVSATGFYKKFGFTETDEKFNRSGINYIIMKKELNILP
jgi:predicted GNAT family N-acyltransferase